MGLTGWDKLFEGQNERCPLRLHLTKHIILLQVTCFGDRFLKSQTLHGFANLRKRSCLGIPRPSIWKLIPLAPPLAFSRQICKSQTSAKARSTRKRSVFHRGVQSGTETRWGRISMQIRFSGWKTRVHDGADVPPAPGSRWMPLDLVV